MQLKINGKDVEFKFGIRFLRELDKHYYMEKNDIKFGLGLDLSLTQILAGYPEYLATYLYCANKAMKVKVTQDDIDEYLESLDDLEPIFDEVIKELSEGNATKSKVTAAQAALKQNE